MSHGSLLGKDGSAYNFFRARFDALTAEESRLLRDTIKLGTSKSDAARRRAIMARIEDIQVMRIASPEESQNSTYAGETPLSKSLST
jgi:hypothetical protein